MAMTAYFKASPLGMETIGSAKANRIRVSSLGGRKQGGVVPTLPERVAR